VDSTADDQYGLIHPAFRARILQIAAARQLRISQATATSLSNLANIVAAFRRMAAAAAAVPEVAQIASAAEPASTAITTSLQRWNSGEIPTSAEADAVASCLRMINTALTTAGKVYTRDNVVPGVPGARPKQARSQQ